jgi:hypothetical protein
MNLESEFCQASTESSMRGLQLLAFAALASSVVAEVPQSAEYCLLSFHEAETGCEAVTAFAVCLASAPAGETLIRAEKLLSAAQEKVRAACLA